TNRPQSFAERQHDRPSQACLTSLAKILAVQRAGTIVAVLLLGCWLGWIVRGARIQREVVAEIEKAGGSVMYDFQRSQYDSSTGPRWAPRWLVKLIGVDTFGHVTAVTLPTTATDLAPLRVGYLARLHLLVLDHS